jgi:PAS domain S-box-containing protein
MSESGTLGALASFVFEESGRVVGWSPLAEPLFARAAGETLGRNLSEWMELSGPALTELVTNVHQMGFAETITTGRKPNGSMVAVRLWVVALPVDANSTRRYFALVNNVDAEREAEQERQELLRREQIALDLVKAERRFRDLLEAAPDGILEVDPDGRIVLMNAAAERLFGYTRAELLGQPVELLMPAGARERHVEHREGYQKDPKTRPMGSGMYLFARRRDGTQFPVEVSLSPIETDHGRRVTAIIRDVSDRRDSERQIREIQEAYTRDLAEKNRQLEQRNRDVEKANRLKSEFLASMSHELRTPLHTIIGFAELLAEEIEGPLNEKQHKFLSYIRHDAAHLLELINDILDLSKIESGRMTLRQEPLSMREIFDEVLNSIRPLAATKGIAVQNQIGEVPAVFGDRVRLKEVGYNLLSNAVKFTPESGHIWVSASCDDGLVGVTVADTGIGIAAHEHQAIFENFYQVGATTKGVREGTGLGLPITRRLVELHGGSIWLESAPGEGSRFTFTIPTEPIEQEATLPPKG